MLIFLIQVWKMRRHQDAWFRLHKPSDLYEAKKYEKLVDAGLKKYLIFSDKGEPISLDTGADASPSPQPTQANLFNLEDGNEATKDQ